MGLYLLSYLSFMKSNINIYLIFNLFSFWLSLQRIPYGRNENSTTSGKPVVFLQHGLLDASHTWVINMPEESLGVSFFY